VTETAKVETTTNKAAEAARRKALVLASPGLQVYGTVDEVAELIRRFKVMLPETKEMTDDEVTALAQVAYVHGLNPLPAVREIVWIPGHGPMVGIRGLRRKGREWADAQNLGYADIRFELITDAVEREQFHIPVGAIAYKCIGGFPAQRTMWVENAKTLRDALGPEAPWQVILDSLGPRPEIVGYGYLTAEEMHGLDNPKWWHKCKSAGGRGVPFFGMEPCPDCGTKSYAQPPAFSHVQHAQKRAEAHFWKQAADLPFAVSPGGGGMSELEDVPLSMEGTWKELPTMAPEQAAAFATMVVEGEAHEAEQAAKPADERKADAKRGSDMLFGAGLSGERVPLDWPAETVEQVAKLWEAAGVMPEGENRKHVIMLMNLSNLTIEATDAEWTTFGKFYRGHRDEGLTSKEAARAANLETARPF
jgi:hypothetical protein